ncbi:MAG: hypothetical protein JSV25_10315 [Spirochaetota bacterium]|nr:MAG: hypothetical protein JSV25_10315 [Spirochaetota bacterium]
MKRTIIICTVAAVFVLSAGFVFAQSGPSKPGVGGSTVDSGTVAGETIQNKNQEKVQNKKQNGEVFCYETKDGKLYVWNNSFNYKLQNYEKEDDEKGLNRYLREIANHYRLGNKSEVDGFVEWALKNRPWSTE